ncbi:DNA cytosine methyltransferase [Salinimonas marina]|uniref:DNA cytosine methyltransferase n=1 Tax=Salinimonas marina TaxID=2785918 RepID=UPI001E28AA4F|nr:DNA (cytosine-5-)-methyltransferase [Salinimonas marina]
MSVEREASAHKTLTLRAFYRLLKATGSKEAVNDYFNYVGGSPTLNKSKISKEQLICKYSDLWEEACAETLYEPTALGEDNDKIKARLLELKNQYQDEPWVVIGGPPCQAYSLVGRARNKGIEGYTAETDNRHFLYREYLSVLSIMQPDVFVMENVKGILSSRINGELIFPSILTDLKNLGVAVKDPDSKRKYHIYSFVKQPDSQELSEPTYSDFRDFIIRAEDYGVPQARHRVILLGIAEDLDHVPATLKKQSQVPIETVLSDLPALRSKISRKADSPEAWEQVISSQVKTLAKTKTTDKALEAVIEYMQNVVGDLKTSSPIEQHAKTESWSAESSNEHLREWLLNDHCEWVLNHHARSHMSSDLGRYLFSACWASTPINIESSKPFPKATDYPEALAPTHANWKSGKFADRFRVQRYGRPATTITSHISKDGHYFIHPDPTQCRSLTVREAARIQTFSDDYFFEGNRTQQYVQVGNAVPPYLAKQLAETVACLFSK